MTSTLGRSRPDENAWGPPLRITVLRSRELPVLVYASALLLTFGYEIFSFHLTIDEELAGPQSAPSYALAWVAQGRWAMGALALLLPNPVVPVVSAGIGVALTGVAWWLICRRILQLERWPAAATAALVGTVPTFAYLYSFSTIAYGIGVGALLVTAFLTSFISPSWRFRLAGIAAATFAVAIYDTFVVVLVVLAMAVVVRRPTVRVALEVSGGVLVSFVLSRLIGQLATLIFHSPQSGYVDNLVDVSGFLAHPVARSRGAIGALWQVLSLQADRVGLHSPFLAITVLVLAVLAVAAAVTTAGGLRARLLTVLATVVVLGTPVAAQAVSPLVPLRSMIYIPAAILVLAALSMRFLARTSAPARRVLLTALAVLCVLTVLGSATISNRMFAASETSYQRDQILAFEIQRQVELQTGGDETQDLAVVASGEHTWIPSAVTPYVDTLGASFFGWDGGAVTRMAGFLQTQGVVVHAGDRKDQRQARTELDDMPDYPADGWVRVDDGRLLLKFGPRTALQEQAQ